MKPALNRCYLFPFLLVLYVCLLQNHLSNSHVSNCLLVVRSKIPVLKAESGVLLCHNTQTLLDLLSRHCIKRERNQVNLFPFPRQHVSVSAGNQQCVVPLNSILSCNDCTKQVFAKRCIMASQLDVDRISAIWTRINKKPDDVGSMPIGFMDRQSFAGAFHYLQNLLTASCFLFTVSLPFHVLKSRRKLAGCS